MTTVDHFTLTIPGRPHSQGRARAGNGRMFTPAATRVHAALIQTEWIAAGRPQLPPGPYTFCLEAYFQRPAGHMLKDGSLSAAGRRSPVPTRMDTDNLIKHGLDSLTRCGAIPDDRWCWLIQARKEWCPPDMQEATIVTFETAATREVAA